MIRGSALPAPNHNDGKSAWDALTILSKSDSPIEEKVNMLITDIEMPQMDGHNLLKRVKEDHVLQKLPVVIFSSLINEEMRRKGEAIGADAQVSKPEIAKLIELIDQKSI